MRSLYVCYYPLTEPLVQTQVVAYLEGLAANGHTIHLLSFETEPLTSAQKRQIRADLRAKEITWHYLKYHKRPSLPATIYDVMCGVWKGLRLIRRHRIDVIHARAHVPATMGLILKKLTGTGLIFDIRGLMAQEYIDIGNWAPDSLPVRLTQKMQDLCIENSDGIVVLTERAKNLLFGPDSVYKGAPPAPLQVIPCCADLTQIEAQKTERAQIREELGMADKTVMIYVGKFGGWYLQAEMVDFFAKAREQMPDLHFLVLSQSERELITKEFERVGLGEEHFTLMQVEPARVGAYLWASDFSLSFIRALPSKVASSPTKIGEYLAAGLPLVCNTGVGDMDTIVESHQVGVSIDEFTPESYSHAAAAIMPLIGDDQIKVRCQRAARAHASLQEVGVPRYCALYEQVAHNRDGKSL